MANEPPMLDPGTVIAGKYRVDGMLGKGGMGAVFIATNTAIGRKVAIKLLFAAISDREDVKRRFELEAQAAAMISHPGIVDVLDMGETDEGEPFIVMEYLEGATLKGVFKRLGAFSPQQTATVIAPLLDALAAAHRASIVHRDIKPANVFVTTKPTRSIKLLDFGVSRFGKSTGLTLTGTAVGTPKYMAPEQVLGEKELGPEADLYSVGAVMYHLLGGKPPHDADSDMATLARILTDVHQPLHHMRPEIDPKLCALVDSLLSKDRTKRPNDAATVREQLLALVPEQDAEPLFDAATRAQLAQDAKVASAGTPSPGPSSPSGSRSKPRASAPGSRRGSKSGTPPPAKPPYAVIGLVVAALVLGGGGAFLALGPKPPPPAPEVAVTPPVRAVPAAVDVTLSADPAEARFTVDGEAMSCNPCTFSRSPGARLHVKIAAANFASSELEVLFDRSRDQHVSLAPVPVQAPVAAPPVEAAKPPPARKKHVTGPLSVDEKNPYQ